MVNGRNKYPSGKLPKSAAEIRAYLESIAHSNARAPRGASHQSITPIQFLDHADEYSVIANESVSNRTSLNPRELLSRPITIVGALVGGTFAFNLAVFLCILFGWNVLVMFPGVLLIALGVYLGTAVAHTSILVRRPELGDRANRQDLTTIIAIQIMQFYSLIAGAKTNARSGTAR